MTGYRDAVREMLAGAEVRGEVLYDEPMKRHTTLRIGGPTDAFVVPEDVVSLRNLLIEASERNIPVIPVGGGSNLLVSDAGIGGIAVCTSSINRIIMIEQTADGAKIFVEAGSVLQRVVNLARDEGYKGLEGLVGVPGLFGGAVMGNAGSFGCEIGDVIESVAVMNRYGRIGVIDAADLKPGYRSVAVPGECVIISANISLLKDDVREVTQRMRGFLEEKRTRQPISEWSAGCVFKNPPGAKAGKLIDEAGCKGMRKGDIEVSGLHANFFINRGEGKASDFTALMEEVREKVMKAFSIALEPEIRIV